MDIRQMVLFLLYIGFILINRRKENEAVFFNDVGFNGLFDSGGN